VSFNQHNIFEELTNENSDRPGSGLFLFPVVLTGKHMSGHHHKTWPLRRRMQSKLKTGRKHAWRNHRGIRNGSVKNGAREVNSFVVYPEVKNKATAVVVIHEIWHERLGCKVLPIN
jgi:hypothetical protein